jgi:hypothetical protein
MTIAIVLKIGDGLVFGADSASTLSNGTTFVNSYFNAEKVFNVVKGLPLGAVTAGLGGLAARSGFTTAGDVLSPGRLRSSSNTFRNLAGIG